MTEQNKLEDAVFDVSVALQRANAILRLIVNEYFDTDLEHSQMLFIERDFEDICASLSVVQCILHEANEQLNAADS